jgi:hypothetical protein
MVYRKTDLQNKEIFLGVLYIQIESPIHKHNK